MTNCIQKDISTQISKQNLFDVGVFFFFLHLANMGRVLKDNKNGSISSTAVLPILQVNTFFYFKFLMKNIVNNIFKY